MIRAVGDRVQFWIEWSGESSLGPRRGPAGGSSKCRGLGEGLNFLEENKQGMFGEGRVLGNEVREVGRGRTIWDLLGYG